ncbi:GerW family sporulation protein [Anaerobacillus sp. MEB173]|uniref:GerW family sporulation protein n=1 Tax=Anaerobacillus sp. MEB173 TaxID=3383345 RepID=UPI003F8FC1CC
METLPEVKKTSRFKSPIRVIFEKLSPGTRTEDVYGEPIEIAGKKVVPVSKVTYFVGGGAGLEKKDDNKPKNSEGEGGGGAIIVKPVGVYEITEKKTRYIPTLDLSALFLLAGVLGIFLSIFVSKSDNG